MEVKVIFPPGLGFLLYLGSDIFIYYISVVQKWSSSSSNFNFPLFNLFTHFCHSSHSPDWSLTLLSIYFTRYLVLLCFPDFQKFILILMFQVTCGDSLSKDMPTWLYLSHCGKWIFVSHTFSDYKFLTLYIEPTVITRNYNPPYQPLTWWLEVSYWMFSYYIEKYKFPVCHLLVT